MKRRKIAVVVVEPNKNARVLSIGSDLKSMQKTVGGNIQAIYPFEDPVAIVCNEAGKLEGLPFNRVLTYEGCDTYDMLFGTFFIVGCSYDDFTSLSKEQAEKYKQKFLFPEKMTIVDERPVVVRFANF